jgi:PAS domain S-box-containing protein
MIMPRSRGAAWSIGAALGAAASALAFRWARRQGRLRAREAQLRLLLEVNQRLTQSIDLGTVLGAIADASATIFKAEVGVRLVDGADLVLVAASPAARTRITRQRLRLGESLAGYVAATGQPLNLADATADPRLLPEHRALVPPEGLATMCVPVRLGTTVLATMAFSREVAHPFREDELVLAMSLGDQAGIAIRNARLHEEAAEALREQQQFLRRVIDVDANCIFAKDRHGRFTLVNQAVAEIYGTTVEDLVGKTDADFNADADQVAWFRRMDLEVMDTLQERVIREEPITDARGRVRWLQTVKRPLIGKDGRANQVLGSATDVTERKRVEDALQARERTLHQLLDLLPIAVYVCDACGIIERYNRRAVAIWGREPGASEEDRFGGACRIYTIDGVHLPHGTGPMAQVLRTRVPLSNQEFVIERPDGSRRTAMVNMIPLVDEQGTVTGAIGCLTDITERKLVEAELQQQRQVLAHLTRVATLGELSGALAHELNQPLTSILANAQAAQRFLDGDSVDLAEVREILRDIVSEDRRAGEVIRRLRALLRKGETQPQPLDINHVLNEVLRLAHGELLAHGVTVTAALTPDLPAVRADRVGLQQVLLNLIMNACDAMRTNETAHRRLTVVTATESEVAVRVEITDRGAGIPCDGLDRVFEPFFTTKEQGLGLGLGICRSIIAAHGGRLWATNNTDRGATFCFVLPAHPDGRGRS